MLEASALSTSMIAIWSVQNGIATDLTTRRLPHKAIGAYNVLTTIKLVQKQANLLLYSDV